MTLASPATRPVLVDLIPRPGTRAWTFALDAGLVLAGAALVSLLAKVSFFIGPIPITGQTIGVLVVGAAVGAASMTTYMLAGLVGLPVFAGPLAGPAYVLAPSFGFVIGFIPAAYVAGWFAERAWDRNNWLGLVGFRRGDRRSDHRPGRVAAHPRNGTRVRARLSEVALLRPRERATTAPRW